jgi:hypothetical protein
MKRSLIDSKNGTGKFAYRGLIFLIISIFVLSGCSTMIKAKANPAPAAENAVQIPSAAQTYVDISRSSLAEKLGLSQDQIILDNITAPAEPNGMYVIKLSAGGQTYVYHGQDQQVSLVSGPVPTVQESSASANDMPKVKFTLDEAVAKSVELNTIPAVDSSDQNPYWALLPEHLEISLKGYAQAGSQLQAKIYVYPAAVLKEMNPAASDQISSLEELLIKKPDLSTMNALPFLPLMNAQPIFYAQDQYLNFEGGSGIRYLTQMSQAASPITNQGLLYTFQGLTNDGKYYVSAIFPVSQSDLPADQTSTDANFSDDFETYVRNVKDGLETAIPNSFTPSLDDLDNLVNSILLQF